MTFTTCPRLIWHPEAWWPGQVNPGAACPNTLSQHEASLGCSDLLAQRLWARQGTGSLCPRAAEIKQAPGNQGEASLPLWATLKWLKNTLCRSWVRLQMVLGPSPSQLRLYKRKGKFSSLETNPGGQKISAVESPSPKESPGNRRNVDQHGTESSWEVIFKTMSTLRLETLL